MVAFKVFIVIDPFFYHANSRVVAKRRSVFKADSVILKSLFRNCYYWYNFTDGETLTKQFSLAGQMQSSSLLKQLMSVKNITLNQFLEWHPRSVQFQG